MTIYSPLLFIFLYFPEDKTEYIPAVINLVFITILAFITVRVFIKISKKEELKAKELEKQLNIPMEKEHN